MPKDPQNFDWQTALDRLRKRIAPALFESSVLDEIKSEKGTRILVACSGGADSVFLLCSLWALKGELGLDLGVAHYNHRWRQVASDLDAVFVESLTQELQLPFFTASRPEHQAAFTETTARALRLDFLRTICGEEDYRWIALGHQLNDVIETQLQRLARGCGSEGLAAPRPVSRFANAPTHIRPLLEWKPIDIRMALNSAGIPWCEDESNADLKIARNALRAEIVPALTDCLDRDPVAGAARSRRLLQEDATALEELSREAVPDAFAGNLKLERKSLIKLPKALLRRALAAWLGSHDLHAHFGASAMETLIEIVQSDQKKHLLSAGPNFIRIRPDHIALEAVPANPEFTVIHESELDAGESTFLPRGKILESSVIALTETIRSRIFSGSIDPETEAFLLIPEELPLITRGWRPGDRYQPLGAPGNKKLKDWFIDRHIEQSERKYVPIVSTRSGEIIWVPGFAPAERLKITESTNRALRLTYRIVDPR